MFIVDAIKSDDAEIAKIKFVGTGGLFDDSSFFDSIN